MPVYVSFTAEIVDDLGRAWRARRVMKSPDSILGIRLAVQCLAYMFERNCTERCLLAIPPIAMYYNVTSECPEGKKLQLCTYSGTVEHEVGLIWEEILAMSEPPQQYPRKKKGGSSNGQG